MAELSVNPQQWERGPKIVAVGGGTGLSTMLRGLKKYTKNLTAVAGYFPPCHRQTRYAADKRP